MPTTFERLARVREIRAALPKNMLFRARDIQAFKTEGRSSAWRPRTRRLAQMSFGRTTPILRIFDEAKAKEFYVDFLGFRVDWEHRFEDGLPLYMQVSKDCCVIHLSEHHGDCSPGAAMRIETNELEAFQKELLGKNYKNARPGIEKTSWGSKDMSIADPFGNRLTFTDAITT